MWPPKAKALSTREAGQSVQGPAMACDVVTKACQFKRLLQLYLAQVLFTKEPSAQTFTTGRPSGTCLPVQEAKLRGGSPAILFRKVTTNDYFSGSGLLIEGVDILYCPDFNRFAVCARATVPYIRLNCLAGSVDSST